MLKILTALYKENKKFQKNGMPLLCSMFPFVKRLRMRRPKTQRQYIFTKTPRSSTYSNVHPEPLLFPHSFKVKKSCSVVPLFVHIYGWKLHETEWASGFIWLNCLLHIAANLLWQQPKQTEHLKLVSFDKGFKKISTFYSSLLAQNSPAKSKSHGGLHKSRFKS